MSGKAYTMKEMKGIVDYLTENKAYSEIKGRKMWMDYASSKLTNRTWQSLKETFLKRILPDIHNPYYKLTVTQIASFRQGCDIDARINNKLEVRTVNEASSTNANNNHNNKQPSERIEEEILIPGEDPKCSKITNSRSSSETFVLENCYETAQDIERDLVSQSPKQVNKEEKLSPSPQKSLRDCIIYSEPLTPMMQEVLHDFATDEDDNSSDREPRMQIVEENTNKDDSPIEIMDTEQSSKEHQPQNENNTESTSKKQNKKTDKTDTEAKNKENPREQQNNSKEPKNNESNLSVMAVSNGDNTKNNSNKKNNSTTQLTSNNISDTVLPNNQEALDKGKNTQDSLNASVEGSKLSLKRPKNNEDLSRKRSSSQDAQLSKASKGALGKQISISDTDTIPTKKRKETALKNKTKKLLLNKNNSKVEHKTENGDEKIVLSSDKEGDKEQNNGISPADKNKHSTKENSDISASKENPCLQSVSLYAEQFSSTKYTDSEDCLGEEPKQQDKTDKPQMKSVTTDVNNVVVLKSHSDTESNGEEKGKKNTNSNKPVVTKSERSKALANVFGFSSGGVTSKQKRRTSYRRKSASRHHQSINISSGSSEWTSETEPEFISPPRGRKNRQNKKYLKPKSARILSLEEEGGLFVMYGKHIYPLVKDGKVAKNYVTFMQDDDSDNEASHWKLKYVEEKKRTAELTKLIEQVTEKHDQLLASTKNIAAQPSNDGNTVHLEKTKEPTETVTIDDESVETMKNIQTSRVRKSPAKEDKVKIKFTKNNEELQLEGHWTNIHPVLAHVVQIFNKEEPQTNAVPATKMEDKPIESGLTTPLLAVDDVETREKVLKIEEEIFKEIEERDKVEDNTTTDAILVAGNVTKRKAKPRQVSSSTSAPPSPVEELNTDDSKPRKKTSNESAGAQSPVKKKKIEDFKASPILPAAVENQVVNRRSRTRTPKIEINNTDKTEQQVKTPKRGRPRKQIEEKAKDSDDNSEIRYRFPSPPEKRKSDSTSSQKDNNKEKPKNRYESEPIQHTKMFSPTETSSQNSVDSTQGYQDSDVSPVQLYLKKKRKLSVSTVLYRGRKKNQRKKKSVSVSNDVTSDSSNSFVTAPLKSQTFSNSSIDTEIYRSDSYKLLMPREKNSFHRLEKIEEIKPEFNNNVNHTDVHKGADILGINLSNARSDNATDPSYVNDAENSSSITLPTSPVLSIVENLSINKSMLGIDDFKHVDVPNEPSDQMMLNEFMVSKIDASVPLMKQDSELLESCQKGSEYHYKFNLPNDITRCTDNLINQIDIINVMDNRSLSDTINNNLRNLLLDSAKKQNVQNDMEIDSEPTMKKPKSKKRCSTPRKKQSTRKSTAPAEPFVEEEHMESCSYSGRRSCPPLVLVSDIGYSNIDNANADDEKIEENASKINIKRKKDIIKVKITRPRNKNSPAKNKNNAINISKTDSEKSLRSDRVTNESESGIFLQGSNDSVDLIHNHSETCLHANECIGDSIEILQNTVKSIISLDSTHSDIIPLHKTKHDSCCENNSMDLFCCNAQDCINVCKDTPPERTEDLLGDTPAETVYHTPTSNVTLNSLMTEDLSDDLPIQTETRISKWYLFSEDETTNTNLKDNLGCTSNSNYGSYLQHIFPLTCAVPDLSTITEMSKENETTRRFDSDGDTMNKSFN